jgi:hypothetical protein
MAIAQSPSCRVRDCSRTHLELRAFGIVPLARISIDFAGNGARTGFGSFSIRSTSHKLVVACTVPKVGILFVGMKTRGENIR